MRYVVHMSVPESHSCVDGGRALLLTVHGSNPLIYTVHLLIHVLVCLVRFSCFPPCTAQSGSSTKKAEPGSLAEKKDQMYEEYRTRYIKKFPDRLKGDIKVDPVLVPMFRGGGN